MQGAESNYYIAYYIYNCSVIVHYFYQKSCNYLLRNSSEWNHLEKIVFSEGNTELSVS